MELLPCSDVNYAGNSDCPQRGSVTTFMYDGQSNCNDQGEVQVADVKVNDLVLNVEGSHFELGRGRWRVNESPTSGHANGDSYFEFDADGQKFSCDFHDSEDSQDQCTEGSLASERSQLPANTTVSILSCRNREGTSSLSELKWPEQDEPMAVWVKWRGMWQAGIRCARADWPLSTLKAKPTHDRKKYLVIFFPRTRNYSWADVLLVRPINEFPEPIPYRTHKVGVKMVKDLTLARRFILQKLAVSVINIINQLHSEALTDTARNLMVWKEFAVEVSRCKDFSDIGSLLLKLQKAILQCYLSSYWLQHSLQSWVNRCQNADSAESVELLKEELADSIQWNEVHSLLYGVVQPDFNSEWKTWKQEVMKSFSMPHPIAIGGDIEQQCNDSPSAVELQISRKRPKLVVRRAEAHTLQVETQYSHQSMNVEIDCSFFDGRDNADAATSEAKPSEAEVLLEGAVQSDPPCSEADKWDEIVVEGGNNEVIQTKDFVIAPINRVVTDSLDPGSKNRQCIAFVESKGRQCVRYANDGDVYCCVHLASRFVGNSLKIESSASDAQMCEGTTVLNTKCKHHALIGTSFCKKHRPQNDARMMLNSHETKLKRKHEEGIHRSETTNCEDVVQIREVESPLQVDPISVMVQEGFNERSLIVMPEQLRNEFNGTEIEASIPNARMCEGTTVLGTKCKHRALTGTSFCKKHRPQNDPRMMLNSPESKMRKHEETVHGSETTNCKDIVVVGEVENLQVDPVSVVDQEGSKEKSSIVMPEQLRKDFNGTEIEASTSDAQMCKGTTVLGTKCKHRALPGTSFCKKHCPQNDLRMMLKSPESKLKRKHDESIHISETTDCKNYVVVGEIETLQVDPSSAMVQDGPKERSLVVIPEQLSEFNDAEVLHCIGSCTLEASEPCLESPKRHSLYCEKHLPSWLKRARNGKSRIISKEVFIDLLKDCYSREQKLRLHQACELFYKFFKSILSLRNPAPMELQLRWAISEASKNVSVGEVLMTLVSSEKERLRKLWGFTADKETKHCSSVEEHIPIPIGNDSGHENANACKICSKNFSDDQSLGKHWMDSHIKEAKWLFRGYACAICLDSFTNKKLLESHVQERHHAKFVEQCLLLQCIPCGSHFGHFDQLWLHVLSVHPSSFSLSSAAQQHNQISLAEYPSHKLEPGKAAPVESIYFENEGGLRKFMCRFCGLTFDLLPDLGRHHQAAHMGQNPVGPRLPKRGTRFYAYKLKSGRLNRPRFKKGLGAASYKIRNRVGASVKKHIQISSSISKEELKVQSHVSEADKLGRLAEPQCSDLAKILFSEITKTKPRPSNFEILSQARSACCKVSLQALLEEKYGMLPERLYLKAAKLCSEHNIIVNWHQEGFSCPKGCKRITNQPPVSPLIPDSDAVRPRSSLCQDATTDEWEMDECHFVIDSRHFRQEPMQRTIILCDDISFGQEPVPIACVVDENLLGSLAVLVDGSDGQTTAYSMPWEGFTYVRKPLLDQSLGVEAESLQLGCACAHSTCSSETCDHVYLFDNDYEDAKDIYGTPMNGRFAYDERGRIILEEGYLVYECNKKCNCSKTCQNRVLQNGVQVRLEVFKTEEKGWAVRAGEPILRGTFVCEYIGEIIDDQEAIKRHNRYGGDGCSYFYEINAHSNDMSRLIEEQVPYVIDATNYGNVSRYINHSCLPNLMNHQVLVESMDCQLAHIGLYASRDIAICEELTYDYHHKLLPGEGCPCYCGAPNCKGRVY